MKKLILFFLQFPILFFGQQKVQILDSETSKPIPNARIISNNQVYYPNDEGFILLAENTGDLSISAFGYINQNIKYAPIIKLQPKYQDIDEVKITSVDVTKILKLVSKNYNNVYYDKPQLYDITISQRSFENNNMKLLMIADGKFWSRDGQYNAKEAFNNKYNNFLQVEIDHLRYLKSEKTENPVKVKKQDTSQDYTGDMFFSYELFRTLRLATGKNVKTSGKLLAENGDEQDISFMIKTDRNMVYKGFILYNKRDKAITHFELDFNQSSSEPYKLKDENGLDYQRQLGDGLIIFDFYKSFIADSLIVNDIPFPKNAKLNTSNIIRHKPGSNQFEDYDLLENTVLKLATSDHQIWQLSDEKKEINQLKLQKATSRWAGRNWTAWFCETIPFPEGPYKFRGLPGLIVELYDDKGNYHFALVKSEKLGRTDDNQFLAAAKEMGTAVTWEKYKSAKLKYYESPVNYIKNGLGTSNDNEFFLNDGTVVTAANSREINANLRKAIKTYNNPIELTRIINYP